MATLNSTNVLLELIGPLILCRPNPLVWTFNFKRISLVKFLLIELSKLSSIFVILFFARKVF